MLPVVTEWDRAAVFTAILFDRNGASTHTYTYQGDATDRLLTVDTGSYGYDPGGTGDTTGRPGQSFGWDAFGQLQNTSTSGGSVAYTRDMLGRVRERVQRDGAGTITADTIYRSDGSNDAPAYETNAAGTAITKSYLSGADGLTVTYGGNRSGSPTFDYADIHGNVVLTVDGAGSTSGGPYTYDPFGIPTGAAAASPYGFVGKWQKLTDPLSGLIIMGARPYDPAIGRFLSVDPVAGGSANDYDYAFQEPVNRYDLSGNCVPPITILCVAGAVEAADLLFALSASFVVLMMARSKPHVIYYDLNVTSYDPHSGGKWPGGPNSNKTKQRVVKAIGVAALTGAALGGEYIEDTWGRRATPRPSPGASQTYGPPAPAGYGGRYSRHLE